MEPAIFSNLSAGIFLGFSAGIAPGPMLTLIIAQTLRFGVREGCKLALVPLLSDAPVLISAWLVAAQLQRFQMALGLFSCAGGALLLWLGYESWQTRTLQLTEAPSTTASLQQPATPQPQAQPQSWTRGILLNLLNPHPWLFWLTVGVPLLMRGGTANVWAGVAFVAGFYALLIGMKLVIVLLLGRLRHWLTGPNYGWTMRGLALLMWLFAAVLLRDGLRLLR